MNSSKRFYIYVVTFRYPPKSLQSDIAEFMENGLESELDEELGFSKYDYKNEETDNSWNGHSSKTLRTRFGDIDVSMPRDGKGKFEPQLLKRIRPASARISKKRFFPCAPKG